MALFCFRQLQLLKTKRLFKQLKLYAMWQRQWIAQVRSNAMHVVMRESFRDMVLYAAEKRFKRYCGLKAKKEFWL